MMPSADDHDMRIASMLVSHDGTIRYAHPGLRAVVGGVEAAGFEGRALREVLPAAELAPAMRALLEGSVSSRALTVRLEAPIRHLHLSMSVVRSLGSEPLVMLLVASVDDWDARAAQRLHGTIDLITAGFAHEVRNPIAAILGITEAVLSTSGVGAIGRSMLQRIPELVGRVERIVRKSLRFSRPRLPTRTPQRLAELVECSVESARRADGATAIDVRVGDDLQPVMVDASQLEQVLVSLLHNAYEAARSRVRVTARSGATGGRGPWVQIEIEDDGPGISPEVQPRIFDPFFTTKAENTGLGLAIARELTRLNGGDLELHSTSERGTCFALRLECLPPRAELEVRP